MPSSTDARPWLALAALLILTPLTGAAQTKEELLVKFSEGSHTYVAPTGETITRPFRLLVPEGYDSSLKYPIVLALHGKGAWGNDNWKQILWDEAAVAWADTVTQRLHPSFILAPQAPPSYSEPYFSGNNAAQHSLSLLDSLLTEYAIDADRVYITGLSMGGFATWQAITERPDYFAAAVPMSGGGWNTFDAPSIAHLPIWAFHGEIDTITPETTRGWFRAFESLGLSPAYPDCELDGTCKNSSECSRMRASHNRRHLYSELAGQGHVIWEPVYQDPVLTEWVFSQRRGRATVARTGATVMLDVDANSVVSGEAGRSIGVVGDRFPLDWETPLWLCPDLGTGIFGGNVEFPDTTLGELNYRFVHFGGEELDIVRETRADGDRTLTLQAPGQSVPVLFWNDEDEKRPSPVELTYPTNEWTSRPETHLTWGSGAIGGRWDLELDPTSVFTSPILQRYDLRESALAVGGLDTLQTYHWRARAVNIAGAGDWSEREFFTVGVQPQLLSPADGATDQPRDVTLSWRPYLAANSYRLELADNEAFDGALSATVRSDTQYQATELKSGTRYYWRVAWRAVGAVPSLVWSFVTAYSTDADDQPVRHTFAAHANYPNPFRGSTAIGFSVPRAGSVTLSVLDLAGREVRKMTLDADYPGEHEFSFDGSGLPSGVYFYRLESGGSVARRRMVVLK